MKEKEYRLVMVEWLDSMGSSGEWGGAEKLLVEPENIVIRSVGWLLVDGERYKIVVPHMHDEEEKAGVAWGACGEIRIPACAVLSIRELK